MLQSPSLRARAARGGDARGCGGAGPDAEQVLRVTERLLPYAVLFGHEREWSDELASLYAARGEQPGWYSGRDGFNAVAFSAGVSSFTSASSSSWSGSASSSSSGGSGGGGSSGGGGGGGGGGGAQRRSADFQSSSAAPALGQDHAALGVDARHVVLGPRPRAGRRRRELRPGRQLAVLCDPELVIVGDLAADARRLVQVRSLARRVTAMAGHSRRSHYGA